MSELLPIEDLSASDKKLVKLAFQARKKAHAPYSNYLVGSVVIDSRGKLFTGCNVENASYPASLCAERTAIVKMVSRGGKQIKKIIVAASSDEPVFPCGMCLQVIAEFGKKCEVIAVNRRGTTFRRAPFKELFPYAFSSEKLNG